MKRILAMTLVLIMALSLFGCGKAVKFEDAAKPLAEKICEERVTGYSKPGYSIDGRTVVLTAKDSIYSLDDINSMMEIGWTDNVQTYLDGANELLDKATDMQKNLEQNGLKNFVIRINLVDKNDASLFTAENGEVTLDNITPILERTDTLANQFDQMMDQLGQMFDNGDEKTTG